MVLHLYPIQVTFAEGRIVEGMFAISHNGMSKDPILIADGKSYSGLQAIERGLFLSPVTDPIIDQWLNTIRPCA